MKRFLLSLALLLAVLGPAEAHKLKVFAAVEGNSIHGYAFFIGGGRAENTSYLARDADGAQLADGLTDDNGAFAFDLSKPPASDVTITVDTHEGHIASATLAASRFGVTTLPAAASMPATKGPQPETAPAPAAAPGNAEIAALVDAAVQRQVEPLMEQIDQMDSRLRLTDVVSGVFLILGLAGMASWALGRRK
ncbi:cobalamin biosynthesis protein CbiL [Mesorhizobium sp. BR1-1-16]|uniref:cobalamin biosynthesis protein CbiL n=1 Tax=Mesorhizobium sp. BR1-1-16 TaxID=2876653 RepID=UPI001CCE1532|nr:cobalamin biosynthesis protein CbiL [Mesorhizobium sp. BR1-1-16]MBZ9937218.1 cobalamin biosynthesis protein CbiL [Mesorhizobium sp. BR1-1-16]